MKHSQTMKVESSTLPKNILNLANGPPEPKSPLKTGGEEKKGGAFDLKALLGIIPSAATKKAATTVASNQKKNVPVEVKISLLKHA